MVKVSLPCIGYIFHKRCTYRTPCKNAFAADPYSPDNDLFIHYLDECVSLEISISLTAQDFYLYKGESGGHDTLRYTATERHGDEHNPLKAKFLSTSN